jgi:putative toxin-antitoxin system antitoxin component (TIGR02293 family)
MTALTKVPDVLGLRAGGAAAVSPVDLIARIEEGLPVDSLERVARLISPGDAQFKYRLIPKATYERRKSRLRRNKARLSPAEGTRLARMAQVWGAAMDVWHDEKIAREFLFRPHSMMKDMRPIDLAIRSEFGAQMVIDILARLRYGSAA